MAETINNVRKKKFESKIKIKLRYLFLERVALIFCIWKLKVYQSNRKYIGVLFLFFFKILASCCTFFLRRGKVYNFYNRANVMRKNLESYPDKRVPLISNEYVNGRGWFPSPQDMISKIAEDYQFDYNFRFLEVGSGMGDVLFDAAKLPFHSIIGVEQSSFLVTLSRQFLSQKRGLTYRNLRVVNQDIIDYEFDGNYVIHIFNCLEFNVLFPFVKKIEEAISEGYEFVVLSSYIDVQLDEAEKSVYLDDRGEHVKAFSKVDQVFSCSNLFTYKTLLKWGDDYFHVRIYESNNLSS